MGLAERNRGLKLAAALSYLGLSFLLAYFVYFPTIFNAGVTNLLLVSAVTITFVSLIIGAFMLKKKADIWYLLPQTLVLAFVARAIPNLRLDYPYLHDPYYYFSAAVNVINYGTLAPKMTDWFSSMDIFLHWPVIHILTASLAYVAGLAPGFMLRFQEPLLGIVFFLLAFSLANVITGNYTFSFIAALLATFSDMIIFYQSEYHPQGLAIVFLILVVYLLFKYLSFPRRIVTMAALTVVAGSTFMFSHYFTPLFISLILAMYLFFLTAATVLGRLKVLPDRYLALVQNVGRDYKMCVFLLTLPLAYEIIYYNLFLYQSLFAISSSPIFGGRAITAAVSFASYSAPLITSMLSLSKWILLILAVISTAYVIHARLGPYFRVVVIVVSLLIAGVVSNIMITSPTDRVIAFYTTFAAILASLAIVRLREWSPRRVNKNLGMALAIALVAILVICGFFNAQLPAFYFKDSPVDPYYWYSNDLSSMGVYQNTGDWINLYTPSYSYYMIEFDTRILPYFYGNRSYNNVTYFSPSRALIIDYSVLNPHIPYSYDNRTLVKKMFIGARNLTYNNGVIDVVLN